jgi:signal transduction histidine kinase
MEIEYQNDTVLLSVEDDGCGFNPKDPAYSPPGHWGIASMRERAATVGGSFNIASRVGGGAQVEVVLPCDAESDCG